MTLVSLKYHRGPLLKIHPDFPEVPNLPTNVELDLGFHLSGKRSWHTLVGSPEPHLSAMWLHLGDTKVLGSG